MVSLPNPRGPLSEYLLEELARAGSFESPPPPDIGGEDDCQLCLALCYELHYRGLPGVEDRWEWDPSLLRFRAGLERRFQDRLLEEIGDPAGWGMPSRREVELELRTLAKDSSGRTLSRFLEKEASLEQFCEFAIHRSIYQLKEADPHSWAIPRLTGAAKAALMEIQADEYGSGDASRMHSELFAQTMKALGLDSRYGAYLDLVPGATLATVNLMSMLGLHREWRAALAGHLALFEMTSSLPNRRYGAGLRRLGFGEEATRFFDVHVVADAVHELIALTDLVGPLVDEGLGAHVLFGARALYLLEERAGRLLLDSWDRGETSLRTPAAGPLVA